MITKKAIYREKTTVCPDLLLSNLSLLRNMNVVSTFVTTKNKNQIMKQRSLFLIAAMALAMQAGAQEKKQWTLDDCIAYALEKNIQLQQNRLSLQETEEDVKNAKAALFPSLSFSTGHNLVNRPYQEQSATVSGTEIITSDNKNTSVIGMFVINAISGNNVNIINYREQLLNEYSGWEAELKTEEERLQQWEESLEQREEQFRDQLNNGQ